MQCVYIPMYINGTANEKKKNYTEKMRAPYLPTVLLVLEKTRMPSFYTTTILSQINIQHERRFLKLFLIRFVSHSPVVEFSIH